MQSPVALSPSMPPAEPADALRTLRDDGSVDPASDPRVGDDLVVSLYKDMALVRALDERLVALQRQGKIGFHIGSHGEEAAILGSAAALRAQDWIFPCYREFGAALRRGMPLASYVNHMFGNEGDPIKGRQMPDHYGSRVAKFASISSPVGTQITHAAGFAWAARIDKKNAADMPVTLVYFGEGATSSGEFHNGANFAGVFKVPLVLFCRNNGWATSLPADKQTASEGFAAKGVAYGIPAVRCDGNDLFAVLKATMDAVARAAAGEGPTLVEALTSRLPPRDASEAWRRKDPIARVRRHLESRRLWTDDLERELGLQIAAKLDEAIAAAEKLGPPAQSTLFDDVYGSPMRNLDEQRSELSAAPHARKI